MDRLRRLSRIVLASFMVALLSLSVAPAFSVQAQQKVPAESPKVGGQRLKGQEKKLAEGELTPLSEEEMAGVEGEWAQALVGIGVGVALFMAQTWQANHNAHGHPSEIHLHTRWTWRGPQPYVEFHHNLRR